MFSVPSADQDNRQELEMMLKHFMLFTLLLLSMMATAEVRKQARLNFTVNTQELYQGHFQYSLLIISPQKLSEKYPDFIELDSLKLTQLEKVKILVTKSAFIVSKPVGFFDHQAMSNEKFLSHLLGEQKVERLGENHFKITVPEPSGLTYVLKSYFDSDDISTLPNSRVIRAVTQTKKLDVLSGGASSIIVQELTEYSRVGRGGILIRSFIPLKENKTLILSYGLQAIRNPFAQKKLLEENFVMEMQAQKSLIESYK